MKKIFSVIIAAILISCIFSSCKKKVEPFPPYADFASRVEVVSITEKNDGNFEVKLNAILKNVSEKEYVIYGNPTCWSVLHMTNQNEAYDLPLSKRTLTPGGEIVEEKVCTVSKTDYDITEFYIVSQFYIENENGEKQFYEIISETGKLSKEGKNA